MKKFKKTYIEITNICNLSCDFCPKTKREAKFMNSDLFEDTLMKIKGHSKNVYFHVMGEPLLHPEIGLFLDLCHKYEYDVILTTNGTLINKTSEKIISKPALKQINFSLHSFEANKSKYTMNTYIENIFDFIKDARKENNFLISLRLWNMSDKGKNAKNVDIFKKIEDTFTLDYNIEDKLPSVKSIKLAQNVFLNKANTFDWPDIDGTDFGNTGFCYGLRDQIAILVDGTVVPCCLDSEGTINLGNIKNNDLLTIIGSSRATGLYNGFSNRKVVEKLCKRCGYRNKFELKKNFWTEY